MKSRNSKNRGKEKVNGIPVYSTWGRKLHKWWKIWAKDKKLRFRV